MAASVAAVVLLVLAATPTYALNCVPFEEHLRTAVGDEDYLVFNGTPTEQERNERYDRQTVRVRAVHQGEVPQEIDAYFMIDGAWGYMCGTGPTPLHHEATFVGTKSEEGRLRILYAFTAGAGGADFIREQLASVGGDGAAAALPSATTTSTSGSSTSTEPAAVGETSVEGARPATVYTVLYNWVVMLFPFLK